MIIDAQRTQGIVELLEVVLQNLDYADLTYCLRALRHFSAVIAKLSILSSKLWLHWKNTVVPLEDK
jgi:hypothetical protein